MSSIAQRTFQQVCADAAALLNDLGQQDATAVNLLPFLNQAWGEIQDEFAIYGLEFGETVIQASNVSYTALASTIALAVGITDFAEPIEIWERGSIAEEWNQPPMRRVMRLPAPSNTAPGTLGIYEFSEGLMKVNPCSVNRLILLRYQKQFAYVSNASLPVGIDGFYFPLVALTAANYALTTERPTAGALEMKYEKRLDAAITRQINNQQKVDTPRRPFNSGDDGNVFIKF